MTTGRAAPSAGGPSPRRRPRCRRPPPPPTARLAALTDTGSGSGDRLQGLRSDERAGGDLLRDVRRVPRVERRSGPARRLHAARQRAAGRRPAGPAAGRAHGPAGRRRRGDVDAARDAGRTAGRSRPPAGLDHLLELRDGQRPDARLLLALRHGARGRHRARRRGRRGAADGPRDPAGRDPGRHRRRRRHRGARVRVPAAEVPPPDTGIDTASPSLADVSVAPSPAASASAQPSASAGASPSAEPSAPASPPRRPSRAGRLAFSVRAERRREHRGLDVRRREADDAGRRQEVRRQRPGVLVRRRRRRLRVDDRAVGPDQGLDRRGHPARQCRWQRPARSPTSPTTTSTATRPGRRTTSSSPSRRPGATRTARTSTSTPGRSRTTTDLHRPRGRPGRRLGPGLCPGRRHDRVRLGA